MYSDYIAIRNNRLVVYAQHDIAASAVEAILLVGNWHCSEVVV